MGKIVTITEEQITLPNGVAVTFEFVHHPGGAAVVALNEKAEICLLRHYRPVAKGWLWELPAGKRDNNEDPLTTAKRELREEAGVIAEQWQSLGQVFSSPGIFTEVIHLYFASKLEHVTSTPDDDEVLEIHWLPLSSVEAMMINHEINDAKTIVGLVRALTITRNQT